VRTRLPIGDQLRRVRVAAGESAIMNAARLAVPGQQAVPPERRRPEAAGAAQQPNAATRSEVVFRVRYLRCSPARA